ncbi:2Fe-2S iron-sulfur cluster-binding protein [Halococcoides cellulosivorans]|uniref:Ferredoxin n=1 Tax=Halococcoides cellulosivorans TaxID=1679096 RepID=A0A2R4WY16_9EURY|nr:2Fe-2S iron-sulfur cluster-binding protein [Halococcoides cellulosivorans]AWB26437.1 ferredoxin [Halococcoides cellulosivorans]
MSQATESEAPTTVSLTIDGTEVQARPDQTILEAAREADIDVPTLCAYEGLSNVGACRMCLVEIDGERTETACTTTVQDEMSVAVHTDELWDQRRSLLELMFAEENHYCMYCEMEGDCELEDLFNEAGLDECHLPLEYMDLDPDTSHDYITLDLDRCISCGRCIRSCEEVVGNATLSFSDRGREAEIVADDDVPLGESSCVSCGSCVQACPTGALYGTQSAYRGRERNCEVTETTCPECSVGCTLEVYTNSGRIVKIEGAEDGPDGGQLCEKGRFELLGDGRPRVEKARVGGTEESVSEARQRVREILADADAIDAVASDRLPLETLQGFAAALEDYPAAVSVPGRERVTLEDRVVAAVTSEFDVDRGDLYASTLAGLEDRDSIVVYDTSIVDSHPVAASYVRRAARSGADLVTVEDETDRLDRFSDTTIDRSAPLADVTDDAAEVFSAGTSAIESDAQSAAESLSAAVDGDSAIVVGPEIRDASTLANVFGLAAMSGAEVLSLNDASNQVFGRMETTDSPADPDVAYLFAADDRDEHIEAMIEHALAADTVIVQATRESPLTKLADVVLPALDWYERGGTFVDAAGRRRTIDPVLRPRGAIDDDLVADVEVDA